LSVTGFDAITCALAARIVVRKLLRIGEQKKEACGLRLRCPVRAISASTPTRPSEWFTQLVLEIHREPDPNSNSQHRAEAESSDQKHSFSSKRKSA